MLTKNKGMKSVDQQIEPRGAQVKLDKLLK